jgi:hypothetical protein
MPGARSKMTKFFSPAPSNRMAMQRPAKPDPTITVSVDVVCDGIPDS